MKEMVEALKELIAIESISDARNAGTEEAPFGPEVRRALDYCLKLSKELGFRTKRCENYTGYAEIGQGQRLIGVLVHLDVVPAGDGWETDPFTAVVKDGRIYGRGAQDDKGPAMAALYAMKDLMDSGEPLDKRIRIIFGCSEENGEWTDIQYYKETEELPDAGFTPDADFPLIYGEKGIAEIEITMDRAHAGLEGGQGGEALNVVPSLCTVQVKDKSGHVETVSCRGQAAHASTPEKGVNAIGLVMEKLDRWNGEGRCDCRFADFYMRRFGHTTDGSLAGCHLKDMESGEITINPGLLSMDKDNVTLKLDIRYPVSFTGEKVLKRLRDGLDGEPVQIRMTYDEAPMFMDPDSPMIQELLDAYCEITGDDSPPTVMGGGTYAKAMKNIVAYGPVFPGKICSEHESNEYIEWEDLQKAREIYRLALSRL